MYVSRSETMFIVDISVDSRCEPFLEGLLLTDGGPLGQIGHSGSNGAKREDGCMGHRGKGEAR